MARKLTTVEADNVLQHEILGIVNAGVEEMLSSHYFRRVFLYFTTCYNNDIVMELLYMYPD